MQMKTKKELHPIPKSDNRYELPRACYTLISSERYRFIGLLKRIKVPDGYSSNISKCITIKDRKISELKSKDYDMLMQQLLFIVVTASLSKKVLSMVIDISHCLKSYAGL